MRLRSVSIVCCLALLNVYFAARILVLLPLGSKSHKFALMPVLEALAARGHQLTIFSSFLPSKETENIKEFYLGGLDALTKMMKEEYNLEYDWFDVPNKDPVTEMVDMMKEMSEVVEYAYNDLMNQPELRNIMQHRGTDLIIVDGIMSEQTLPLIEHLAVPYVFHCSSGALPWAWSIFEALGANPDYATVPFSTAALDPVNPSFAQRLMNIRIGETWRSLRQKKIFYAVDEQAKKDFPNARPSAEILKEACLVLVNSHPTTDYPRSLPPTIISIGAPHTRPAKPLPQALKSFSDEAKDGVVIFTLGSLIEMNLMPQSSLQMFLKAFAKIPQRVIWKWEGEPLENLPTNILMANWIPQQDLLGHPNTRLFIGHSGMLGFQEAIYHAVPLLGIPFGNDQRANINRAISEGFGLRLDWNTINENDLLDAITRLINEPSYKANATRLSRLMRDELVSGKDLAVYWIEHVLRHKGSKHLQLAGKNLPFYQRHMIDVILFVAVVSMTMLALLVILLRCIVRKCFRRPATAKKNKTN